MERGPSGVLPTTLLNRITHSHSLWHGPFIGIYNYQGSISLQRLNCGVGFTKQRPLSRGFYKPDGLCGPAMDFEKAKKNVFSV